MIYFIVTTYFQLVNADCPVRFLTFVQIHNYLVFETVAPLQGLFLVFVVNYFSQFDNAIEETNDDRDKRGSMHLSTNEADLTMNKSIKSDKDLE